jgi:hypothetical protein
MGKVGVVTIDPETGRPTASVSGRPVDVAGFLAIWERSSAEDLLLARQQGVRLRAPGVSENEE